MFPLCFCNALYCVFIFFHLHVLVYWYFMEIWQSQCMQGEHEMFNFDIFIRRYFSGVYNAVLSTNAGKQGKNRAKNS